MLAAPRTPAVLVSQSAVGYYGDRGDRIVDESTPAGSTFDANVCVAWEAAAAEAAAGGVRLVIMRTGLLLTKDAGLLASSSCPSSSASGDRSPEAATTCPGSASPTRSACCSGHSTPRAASGVYNACAPNPGHQPRVLEVARPSAAPAGGHAGAQVRGQGQARRRARRGRDRRPARPAEAGPGRGLRLPAPRDRRRDADALA